MTQYTRKVVFGTVFVFVIIFLTGVLNYVFRIVLAKNLSVADYGLFFAVLSFFTLLGTFLDSGMQFAAVRFISKARVSNNAVFQKKVIATAFLFHLCVAVVISLIVLIFSGHLAEHFFKADAASLIRLMLIWFVCLPVFYLFNYVFLGNQRSVSYASVEFSKVATVTLVSGVLIGFGFGRIAPAFGYIASVLVVLLIYLPIVRKVYPGFFKGFGIGNSKLFKDLLKYGLLVFVGISSYYILLQTDTLMLTYFRSLEEVGLYQVAVPIAMILLFFANAAGTVIYPLSAELFARKQQKLLSIGINMMYKYFFVFIVPIAALLFSFHELVIIVLFGQEYLGAAFVLRIFSFGTIFFSFYLLNQSILQGIGKPKTIAKIIIFVTCFNVVLNFMLVPTYGIIGAAYATLASYMLAFIFSTVNLRSTFSIRLPISIWLRVLFSGFIFIAVIYFVKKALFLNMFFEFLITMSVSTFTYVMLIFFLKIISLKELKQIFKLIFPKDKNACAKSR